MPSWYRYPICAPVLPHSGIGGQGNGERDEEEKTVVRQKRKGERERESKREQERNKRQDEPRARKSTRIQVRAPGLFLSLSFSLPMVRRLKKNLISDEREQPLPLCARQDLRTAEKRAVGLISTPGVRQRRFISEDPSLFPSLLLSISFKPPTVALGFSSSSSTRLSLFFLNLIFYLVMLLSRNMILLYSTSCTAFCYYGEVPIDVAAKVTNKGLISRSLKKACRDQLRKNWINTKDYKYFLRFPLLEIMFLIATWKNI